MNTVFLKDFKEFLNHVDGYGEKIALVDSESLKTHTYTELVSRVKNVAKNLSPLFQVGDRVAVYQLTGSDWAICFLAIILLGGIAVPIDNRVSPEMVVSILSLTQPKIIIAHQNLEPVSNLKTIAFNALAKKNDSELIFPTLSLNSSLEIIFTSGTWSHPKAVTLSHGNILSNIESILQVYTPPSNSVFLSLLPLSHIYEQTIGLLIPLHCGTTIVYLPDITSKKLIQTIQLYKVTIIVAVPRILEILQKAILKNISSGRGKAAIKATLPKLKRLPVSLRRKLFTNVHEKLSPTLKTFVVAGASLPKNLDFFFQGLGYEIIVGYGLSETSPVLTISLHQDREENEVGKAIPGVMLSLNDQGEIIAEGPNIFLGYWPNIATPTPFNTQDLGEFNKDGHLRITGRTKNLVIFPSGDKIFLDDIELITNSIKGVEESCALYENGQLIALIGTQREDLEKIREMINKRLPFFARISQIYTIGNSNLPRTHTLKINRKRALDIFHTLQLTANHPQTNPTR